MATKSWEGGVASAPSASAPSAAAEISSAALRAFVVAASLVGSPAPHDSQNRKDAETVVVKYSDIRRTLLARISYPTQFGIVRY